MTMLTHTRSTVAVNSTLSDLSFLAIFYLPTCLPALPA